MDPRGLLQAVRHHGATDLHCKPGSPPAIRVGGALRLLTGAERLDAAAVAALAESWLSDARVAELQRTGAVVAAYSESGVGRFRVAAYRQRGSLALVVHQVPDDPRPLAELGLPDVVAELAGRRSGLLLVAAPAANGASTTVAAIVDHVARTRPAHVVTVEDPIEVLHQDDVGLVSQLEVGVDTPSAVAGVRATMRCDADVVAVTLDDHAVAHACLDVACAGRLVVASLPADTAAGALRAITDGFPIDERAEVRRTMARHLAGVVAQRLVPAAAGGRVAAAEVLVTTSKIATCIADDSLDELPQLLADGAYKGMQTMDGALVALVQDGAVELDDALAVAADPEELRIALLA